MSSPSVVMQRRIEQGPGLSMRQAHFAEGVYDRAADDGGRDGREAATGLNAVAAVLALIAANREADPRAALSAVRGERPTVERAVKAGAERVQTGLIDSAQGASAAAVRVGQAWPPDTLFKRRALSRRQYCAAQRVVDLWERGGFDRVTSQSWDMPVDKSGGGDGYESERVVRARRAFGLLWSTLLPVERHVLGAIVIDARTIEHASDSPLVREVCGTSDAKRCASSAGVLLRLALDRCAAALFDGA